MNDETGRVLILMYHIVDLPRNAAEARFCCTPRRFERQIRYLANSGLRCMDLDELSDCALGTKAWPSKGVIVTLDDGFRCSYETALPILEQNHIPSTVFIVAGRAGGTNDWAHQRKVPTRELLGWNELKEMCGRGISLGSHTLTHPRLPEVASAELARELEGSRMLLEDRLGRPVTQIAYPFGDFNESVRNAAERAGYRAACSTRPGFNRPGADRFALRRIEIYGHDTMWMFRQKLRFGMNDAKILFPLRYYRGRLLSRMGLGRRDA